MQEAQEGAAPPRGKAAVVRASERSPALTKRTAEQTAAAEGVEHQWKGGDTQIHGAPVQAEMVTGPRGPLPSAPERMGFLRGVIWCTCGLSQTP